MVERWIYLRDGVALSLVALDRESIGTVDTKIWGCSNRERCLVARNSGAKEVIYSRVSRGDFVVVSRSWRETRENDCVEVCARRGVSD